MFDLMGLIASDKNEIPKPRVATVVQVVTTQEWRGFSFGDTLATNGDTGSYKHQKNKFVATCRHLSPAPKQTKPQKVRDLSPLSPLSPPLSMSFNFLKETPFTEAMIIEGLSRWRQPFDQCDLDDIESGRLTIEQARGYLFLWAKQNLERFRTLRQLSQTKKAVSRPISKNPLNILAGLGIQSPHDDQEFIREKLKGFTLNQKEAILSQYAKVWIEGMEAEPVQHKKANVGRRAANVWLRGSEYLVYAGMY